MTMWESGDTPPLYNFKTSSFKVCMFDGTRWILWESKVYAKGYMKGVLGDLSCDGFICRDLRGLDNEW